MNDWDDPPRDRDEWRVEIALDKEQHGESLTDRLQSLQLDDQARKRLGGSVIVTRDGREIYLYAWHEESAREAERVARELMEADKLVGQITLTRWHPIAEEWKAADEPLPQDEADRAEEIRLHEEEARRERRDSPGDYPWQVVIDVPHVRDTFGLAKKLHEEDLPVKRRFRYVLVGADTEDDAIELGKRLEAEVPEGTHVGVRGNPDDLHPPAFVQLGGLGGPWSTY